MPIRENFTDLGSGSKSGKNTGPHFPIVDKRLRSGTIWSMFTASIFFTLLGAWLNADPVGVIVFASLFSVPIGIVWLLTIGKSLRKRLIRREKILTLQREVRIALSEDAGTPPEEVAERVASEYKMTSEEREIALKEARIHIFP